MRIATHSGMFHADDVFAVATALLVYPDAEVIRTRDPAVIEAADMAIDVGLEYDPLRLRFDHHQEGGADARPNGIPYASFGLVWKEYGYRLACDGKDIIEHKLVIPIDAPDNAVSLYEDTFPGVEPYTVRDFLYSYLSYEDRSETHINEVFMEAVEVAKGLLEREITKAEERAHGIKEVKRILDEAEDKRIIVLERDLPWEPVLVPAPALFVVYPMRDGSWGIKSVPKRVFSLERKKLFPYRWVGKKNAELQEATGVPDARFCHNDRYIAIAGSKDGARRLAELALS